MRYPAFFIISLMLLACNKSDQHKAQAVLPAFSCDDSADDGKFESWDTAVQYLMFQQNTNLRNPDSLVPGYILRLDSADRTISLAHLVFRYQAVYDTGVWWLMVFGLADRTSGQVERWGITSRSNGSAHDTVMEQMDLGTGSGLSAGCKRIYYYGFKRDSFSHALQLISTMPGKVLFKGHYDVQVY